VLAELDGQLGHRRDRPGHRIEIGSPRTSDPGQQLANPKTGHHVGVELR